MRDEDGAEARTGAVAGAGGGQGYQQHLMQVLHSTFSATSESGMTVPRPSALLPQPPIYTNPKT